MPDIMRLVGDALSIISLSILWSFTWTAWKQIPATVLVPMQLTGDKVTRVGKKLGLLFMPVLATVLLLVPTATGVAHNAATTEHALILLCLRAMLAAVLGIMGITHLRKALSTLYAEGAIPEQPGR
jgi:hypothetical protein